MQYNFAKIRTNMSCVSTKHQADLRINKSEGGTTSQCVQNFSEVRGEVELVMYHFESFGCHASQPP
jgi:hypothetical protein